MKSTIQILLILFIVSQIACVQKHSVLTEAKKKMTESKFVTYQEESLWPNPVNPSELVDTSKSYNQFSANSQNFLGFDFISTSDKYDMTFLKGEYRVIEHRDSLISIYTPVQMENREKFEKTVMRLNIEWSPITFLTQDWKFMKDTTFNDISYESYFQIEMDTTIKEKKIYVERHIYVNKETALIDRFERRAYKEDGSIGQQVSRNFYEYNLQPESRQLSYKDPEKYVSTYGRRKNLKTLTAGERAPKFILTDINGDSVALARLKGKKVVLDFSIISCGYCQITLKHINQDDFKLNDEVSWLYLNPVDNKERMNSYMKNMEIPFPVLTDAKEIGEKYGVNGYPTFFLINEEGIIETVQFGYSEDFINTFKR